MDVNEYLRLELQAIHDGLPLGVIEFPPIPPEGLTITWRDQHTDEEYTFPIATRGKNGQV